MKKLILPRRRFLLGSTAAALLAAAPWGARGQSTLNSVVMVGIPQAAGGTVWTVYLPGGAILNTGASTTDGLQEAVDAAFLAASTEAAPGYPLYVLGGEETTGGASVCALQTPVQFPPMQGGYVGLRNVSLANAGAMSLGTPMVRFDSMIYTRIELFGSQVAAGPHAANLAAVKFLPTNPLPQDKAAGINCGDSSFHASNCNSMMVDFSNGGSMTNFAFDIDELNGGSSNLDVVMEERQAQMQAQPFRQQQQMQPQQLSYYEPSLMHQLPYSNSSVEAAAAAEEDEEVTAGCLPACLAAPAPPSAPPGI